MKRLEPFPYNSSYITQRLFNKEMIELYVPPEDIRRSYPRILEKAFNQVDQKVIYDALKSICSTEEQDVRMSICASNHPMTLQQPLYQEIQSVSAISRYCWTRLRTIPDCITTFKNVKFYCNQKTSEVEIYCEYEFRGNALFEMIWDHIESPIDVFSAVVGLSNLSTNNEIENELLVSPKNNNNSSHYDVNASGNGTGSHNSSGGNKKRLQQLQQVNQKKKIKNEEMPMLKPPGESQSLTNILPFSGEQEIFPNSVDEANEEKEGKNAEKKSETVPFSLGQMKFNIEGEQHDITNIVIANEKTVFSIGKTIPAKSAVSNGLLIFQLEKQRKVKKLKFFKL